MGITEKEIKALQIISDCKSIRPSGFGFIYFDNPQQRYLLEAVSNQGNGACYGKKAWRAAGCILGRLRKKGYVYSIQGRYALTVLGEELLDKKELLDKEEKDDVRAD